MLISVTGFDAVVADVDNPLVEHFNKSWRLDDSILAINISEGADEFLSLVPVAQYFMEKSEEQSSLEEILLLLLRCRIYELMLTVRRTAGNIPIRWQSMSDAFSDGVCQKRSAIVFFQAYVRYNCPLPNDGVLWFREMVHADNLSASILKPQIYLI